MDALRAFVRVVESGGFTAAAATLDTTVTAVSRRVRALESRLGTRLLHRTTRRVSLTEAGQVYYQRVRRLLADLEETEAHLTALVEKPRGELRIAAPMSFGVKRLAPLVAEFARRHPALQVQLQLDDRFVDMVATGVDLALRIGHPEDSTLVSRALATMPRVVCAAPAYLDAHGTPRQPAELQKHACLHYSNLHEREEWSFRGPGGPESIAVKGRFCANNGDVLAEAAARGLGVTLLPRFIVEPYLTDGRLTALLEDFQPPPFTLHALYHTRHFVPAKIRLLLDYLEGALGSPALQS